MLSIGKTHENTQQICRNAGFDFVPLVFEARSGGWSPAVSRVIAYIAGLQQAKDPVDGMYAAAKTAQRLSMALQKAPGRLILLRTAKQRPDGTFNMDVDYEEHGLFGDAKWL